MSLFKEQQAADHVLVPLTVGEAARLVSLAERAASARGLRMRYDGSGALVGADGTMAGLTNLARAVSGETRRRWRGLVEQHFDQVAVTMRTLDDELRALPGVGPDVSDRLYLRLAAVQSLPPGWPEDGGEFVPGVRVVPATYADHAIAMHSDLSRLGLATAEATRIGLANLRRIPDELEWLRDDGAEVASITGSMFSAARALVLDTVLRETLRVENPSYGTLVAFPTRDRLLVHVLRDDSVVTAIDVMVSTTIEAFVTQPGPISPHVYYAAPLHSPPSPDAAHPASVHPDAAYPDAAYPDAAYPDAGSCAEPPGWQQVTDCSAGMMRVVLAGPMLTAVRRLGLLNP